MHRTLVRRAPAVLRDREFRLFLIGRVVSGAGDELYIVAAMWLVYSLTGSTLYTGLVGFLELGPALLQFLAGPFVDRWPLRRTLVATQLVAGIVVLAVPVSAALGLLNVAVLLTVVGLVGIAAQLSQPAEALAARTLLADEHLVSGNAALVFAGPGTAILADAAAAVLLAAVGALTLYVANAASFAVAALCFWRVRFGVRVDGASGGHEGAGPSGSAYFAELSSGIAFIRRSIIGRMIVPSLIANTMIAMALAVLPAFADGIGGAVMYGTLLATSAAGFVAGTLIAPHVSRVPLGRLTVGATLLSGTLWLAGVVAGPAPLVVALYALAWLPISAREIVSRSAIMRLVPRTMLGRTQATTASFVSATTPVGYLVGGMLGTVMPFAAVVALGGVGLMLVAGYWLVDPQLRRLPPIADLVIELEHGIPA